MDLLRGGLLQVCFLVPEKAVWEVGWGKGKPGHWVKLVSLLAASSAQVLGPCFPGQAAKERSPGPFPAPFVADPTFPASVAG